MEQVFANTGCRHQRLALSNNLKLKVLQLCYNVRPMLVQLLGLFSREEHSAQPKTLNAKCAA